MDLEESETDSVMTQVSIGGFDNEVKAYDLVSFLESRIGYVDRCRLKTSCTPPESYPEFNITNTAQIETTDDYKKVAPHAFVHFTLQESATEALNASGQCDLFLHNQPLTVLCGPQNPNFLNRRRRTATPFKMSDVIVEIGTLVSPEEFVVAWRGPDKGLNFLVDPFDSMCKLCFNRDTAFSFKGIAKTTVIKCDFKVGFLVRDIEEIKRYDDTSHLVVLLHLASSPLVWYRTADDDIEESVTIDLLDDDDPWIRTTDFTPSGAIGRCNFYRISIPPRYGAKLNKAMEYLRCQRVQRVPLKRPLRILNEPDFGVPMSSAFFYIDFQKDITFDIMFLINAIVHKGIFNQYSLSYKFFELLRSQPKDVNVAALKHLCSYKRPVFDAAKRLKTVQEWLLRNPKLYEISKQFDDIMEVRRLVITPTKAYCIAPEVELSNRVLRRFREVSDRFLRVTFMDEGMQTLNVHALNYYVAPIVKEITSNSFPQKTRIYKRVKTILEEGFYFCGRKYSFLAFSSNQLRDRSAWFFAEDNNITCDDIRNWMGKFNQRNVAKCAARMGQCFSSTYASVEVAANEVNSMLADVERNNYVFSDGIGIITNDLAVEVAEKLKLDKVPSAYQIRYAGFKGVVACWPPKGDGIRLSLRPSMNKFQSTHTTLEICAWTRFQPGFLNRQIITLLSALDVSDGIFWDMQEVMISRLNQMLVDADVAFDVLTKSCAEHGNAAAIMLSCGFSPKTEPHLRGMLNSIRAAQLWGLREKSRIFVSSGRWLMGVLDELGVLEQGQCFVQVSTPSLENCFSKHGSRFSETKTLQVVKGLVVIAKNPCLHPGDVRVLEAVDVPDLHHLYDCLVFPQKGERPHTNEASGSDLDGDLYFVTWDGNLIPPSKRSWTPMEYAAQESKLHTRQVTIRDIIDFFVKNMVNEHLGSICNAHVVHADCSDYGALDEKCIHLAELAATAVDFPKTGKLVTMPPHLKPKLYPDFMGKEHHQSYKSKKILGRLYRQIKDAYDKDIDAPDLNCASSDIHYDTDLEVPGSADFISDAWYQKCSYDGQLSGLLGQYKVKTEEEVVTGQIWSMPKYNSRKQGELKERLKHSYSALKKEFRQTFEKLNLDIGELSDEEKNLLYEQKASAWYQVAYHPKWVKRSHDLKVKSSDNQEADSLGNMVMLSFPWIAVDYLARTKIRRRRVENFDSVKPVDSLAKYLSERL
ncbi:RNA-dependent RNA polymerase 6 [Cicer arietinum]|uniref:RNA-dependent RNA polymerase n=1 Tax=Cicer arietinum TaxID=3827 RepID=A0A1S2Y902_CICAR|nr:RNA-dependent RNA polymerase 6 [Cicer arietinum]XP_004501326.1 RNA-dependent RNA polymerase 6 [Cicer arietinum]XP_012571683.1 RNA-dependent RNA polymerase 6 [Cicer arietinum]XP_012571684.1 RNA-dependent RNA polymerase 6 [Cicer arietinum]XP_027190605.1 RNA-dependent RNA polymerase 6 [Cicer arietinum]